jgi:hypothetical protein
MPHVCKSHREKIYNYVGTLVNTTNAASLDYYISPQHTRM